MKKALYSLFFICFTAISASAADPEIFLKAIEAEFNFIDMDTDASGNTYVVGRAGGKTSIKKFDSAGLIVNEKLVTQVTSVVAIDVGSNGYLYIAGGTNVVRVKTEDLSLDTSPNVYSITLTDMSIRDIVYSSVSKKVILGAQNKGSRYPRFIPLSEDLGTQGTIVAVTQVGYLDGGGASVRALAADDQGYVYMVGETAGSPASGYDANRGYIAKYDSSAGTVSKVITLLDINDYFQVEYANGWVYVLGLNESDITKVYVMRIDTTLDSGTDNRMLINEFESSLYIKNADYSGYQNDGDTNKKKFNMSLDASNNLYLTGYSVNGSTEFYDGASTPNKS